MSVILSNFLLYSVVLLRGVASAGVYLFISSLKHDPRLDRCCVLVGQMQNALLEIEGLYLSLMYWHDKFRASLSE
jgi:hypothetical protein